MARYEILLGSDQQEEMQTPSVFVQRQETLRW
jgi:hypothetical protein